MSGLMLSKALRMQQEKEEKGLSTLQDEVVELQKSLEEKDAKITSLKEKAKKAEKKNDEATKIHNADISKIKKQDESIKELQANLEAAKRNIANKDIEKNYWKS
jgi:peptidoglycan hydrolase CwlO-like protein